MDSHEQTLEALKAENERICFICWNDILAIHTIEAELAAMRVALKEIAKGEGRFSHDPLTHAANTIDDMKALAVAALEWSPLTVGGP
jgi:hypothetical protein